jgi:magnesium-transporting ATPase (P-type)
MRKDYADLPVFVILGESVPVIKTSLPSRQVLYNAKECTHHTLYSGTTIIQTKYEYFDLFDKKDKKISHYI